MFKKLYNKEYPEKRTKMFEFRNSISILHPKLRIQFQKCKFLECFGNSIYLKIKFFKKKSKNYINRNLRKNVPNV